MKTGAEIQTDIINLLENSELANSVSGSVYRAKPNSSLRPRDSKLEDILVIFTTGTTEQINEGIVTINVFVSDIATEDNGVLVENGRRTAEVEQLCKAWVESLTAAKSEYLFNLEQMIYTEVEPEIHQHFAVIKLHFRILQIN